MRNYKAYAGFNGVPLESVRFQAKDLIEAHEIGRRWFDALAHYGESSKGYNLFEVRCDMRRAISK